MHRFSPLTSPFLKHHTFSSLSRSSRSAISTSPNPTITSMEVEVKLRLPNAVTHQRVSSILSPYHLKTHAQENIFFDGANSELSSKLAVLRLRFYDVDTQCIISLKAKPVISDGISRIEEDEEPIDPSIGRACVSEPWRLPLIDSSRIVRRVREEYGIGEKGLVCLGGFRNVRAVYEWKGLKLELDETQYDFGMNYEIECESCDPERAKDLLEELLKSHGLQYSYSTVSKFAIFRSGKLPQLLTPGAELHSPLGEMASVFLRVDNCFCCHTRS